MLPLLVFTCAFFSSCSWGVFLCAVDPFVPQISVFLCNGFFSGLSSHGQEGSSRVTLPDKFTYGFL